MDKKQAQAAQEAINKMADEVVVAARLLSSQFVSFSSSIREVLDKEAERISQALSEK